MRGFLSNHQECIFDVIKTKGDKKREMRFIEFLKNISCISKITPPVNFDVCKYFFNNKVDFARFVLKNHNDLIKKLSDNSYPISVTELIKYCLNSFYRITSENIKNDTDFISSISNETIKNELGIAHKSMIFNKQIDEFSNICNNELQKYKGTILNSNEYKLISKSKKSECMICFKECNKRNLKVSRNERINL
jgi:hypothetical protein